MVQSNYKKEVNIWVIGEWKLRRAMNSAKYVTSLSAVQVKLGHKKDFKATLNNSLKKTVSELLNE